MGTAPDALKEEADLTVPSANENGLLKVLEMV